MREHVVHSLSGEKVYKCFVQDCSFSFAITLAKMNNYIKLDLWPCKWFMSSRNLAVSRTPLMVAIKHIANTACNSFLISFFFFFFLQILRWVAYWIRYLIYSNQSWLMGKKRIILFLENLCKFFKRGMHTHFVRRIKWWF